MALFNLPSRRVSAMEATLSSSLPVTTSVAASVTAHTKGSYVDIVASTGADYLGFWLILQSSAVTNTNSSGLLDIAIGTAGSEKIIVNNFAAGYLNALHTFYLPLYVPAATRIAVAYQSAISSGTVLVGIVGNVSGHGMVSDNDIYGICTTYGANTLTSKGVTVQAPASANTLTTTPVEITSATTAPVHALLTRNQCNGSASMAALNHRGQILVGAAAGEVALGIDAYLIASGNEDFASRYIGPHMIPAEGINLATGTRLSMKTATTSASAVSTDWCLYAFTR